MSATSPAAWSPDGRFLVYGKGTALYYFSLSQLATGRVPAESLRRIGDGRITSVQWGADGGLYFLSGRSVTVIDPTELYTRALYTGLLAIGRNVGEIPFLFDPLFDTFRVSPDGRFLLLNKGGRNVLLTGLAADGSAGAGEPVVLPHLALPRDAAVRTVIWPAGGALTLLCQVRASGSVGTAVYRLARDGQGRYAAFARTADEGVRDIVLSPDGSTVALVRADEVAWKDYASWEDRGRTSHPSPLHVLWLSADELLIAGTQYTERWSIASSRSALVALSQPGDYGWAAAGPERAQARVDGRPFVFDEEAGSWTPSPAFAVRDKALASENFRVYLEPAAAGPWASVPMVRDVKGWGTAALVPPPAASAEPFPAEEPVDFANVAHGSRTRRREVSLVFNVVESDEGLTEVLNTLSARGLRTTFFVNGQFIRRHPAAVREIADSGHEVGSLFYAAFNLTDARLTVDAEFIRAGLARNEDDYHAATGRELSLLWHAPYYIVNSPIIAAAAEMGYLYVGRDIDPLDWVARTDSNTARGIYFPAADLVERIAAEKKPGSIIPVQIGTAGTAREDYLFQKLDLVVSELARQGYDIVPVSTLIEHARWAGDREEAGTAVSGNDPVHTYREIQIKTANQIRLIVMLYDGAIRHVNLALDSFAEGHRRYDAVNTNLVAAQDILSELMASLDFEKGGTLAKNLFSIYTFLNRQLLDGNLRKDPAPLAVVKKLLTQLRDAWEEISTRKGLDEQVQPATGVNIAG